MEEDHMTSQDRPEARLSVQSNHVDEAGAEDQPILQSFTLEEHFGERLRSSKFEEESRMKSVGSKNSSLPIEGEIVVERSAKQKVCWKMNGEAGDDDDDDDDVDDDDDGVVESTRRTAAAAAVKETSQHTSHFGVSETSAAAAAAGPHLEAPFMVGREGADETREGLRSTTISGDGTLLSSFFGSGSTFVASHSLDMILDATETKGQTKTESAYPIIPAFITATDKKQQQLSPTTSPSLSLPATAANQEMAVLTSSYQTSSSSNRISSSIDSPSTTGFPIRDSGGAAEETSPGVMQVIPSNGHHHLRLLLQPIDTQHFVVVAIDFGTTMSGYAFSFVRDPSSIHMMRKWEGGDPGVINQKTPTTLLLSPDGDFHSFGFTARDFYHDLDNKEAKRWLYFEKFKMALHYNAKLNKETSIAASNGKNYPAIKVFSHALRYFKEHALQELSDQSSTEILNEDIRWVITVPAIWKAPAKQFMRQAAYEAGIASANHPDQLLIALEPEAASIYVRRLRVHQLLLPSDSSSPVAVAVGGRGSAHLQSPQSKFDDDPTSPFSLSPPAVPSHLDTELHGVGFDDLQTSPGNRAEVLQMNLRLFDSLPRQRTIGLDINEEGTRYMVVDCGGGTVDITVHEMEGRHGYLHELYKATGGPFGSVGVDLAFESLLIEIFGSEFIESFKTKRPAGWVDLMIAFESRKRAANPYKDNPLNISLPFSFIDYYKKTKGHPMESAISKYNDHGIRWSSQGMLRLTLHAMKRLFHSTTERIKQAIGNVLNTVKDIKYLFLVGGFAESAILQHEIRHEFSHILKILIPQDVALTILKGAVCFGLDPTVVTVRRSRLTYGVEVLNRFNAEQHPKSKMVRKDGIEWCTEVFDVFVGVDQPMALGDTVVRKYAPAKVGQKTCIINIFSSEKSEVKFVTDAGVIKCGTLTLCLKDLTAADGGHAPPPSSQQQPKLIREIQAVMTFGDTEIKVDAVDVTTGISVGASIDFLNK